MTPPFLSSTIRVFIIGLLTIYFNVGYAEESKLFVCNEIHALNQSSNSSFTIRLNNNYADIFLESSQHKLKFIGVKKRVGSNHIEYLWRDFKNDFLELRTTYPAKNIFIIFKWS